MTVAQDAQITREQWGGFPEARAAAQIWSVSMFIVGHLGGDQYQLYTDPAHPAKPTQACCLVYSGGTILMPCWLQRLISSSGWLAQASEGS